MVQVFFVMLFFPVVMNALQYYIIDSFIKDQEPSDHEQILSEDENEDGVDEDGGTRRRHSRGEDHNGALDSDSENENIKAATAVKVPEGKSKPKLRVESKGLDEYDPTVDGEGLGKDAEDKSPSSNQGAKAKVHGGSGRES